MITKLSHTSLFVSDVNKAFNFYVNKLGFRVHTDVPMDDGSRWLTITTPDNPEQEIVLMGIPDEKNGYDIEAQQALKTLLEKEKMGAGVLYTADCQATYEELKAKGVNITEPKEQFYGTECIVKDGCGNWFSMCQPKEGF